MRTNKLLKSTRNQHVTLKKKNTERQIHTILSWGKRWKISPPKNLLIRIHSVLFFLLFSFPLFETLWNLQISSLELMEEVHYFIASPLLWVCHVVTLCNVLIISLDFSNNLPPGSPESRFPLANWSHTAAPSWNNAADQRGNEWRENLHLTQSLCSMTQPVSHL